MFLTMNEIDIHLATHLGTRRDEVNKAAGVVNQKHSERSDLAINIQGAGAEIAFAKLYNVYPDTSLNNHPVADVVLHGGISIDVKQNPLPNGDLIVSIEKGERIEKVDFFVLLVGQMPIFRVAGYISSADLFIPDNIANLGYGPCYYVKQRKLCPFNRYSFPPRAKTVIPDMTKEQKSSR